MSVLYKILAYYGMPEENIETAVEQIAETYGACRYLDGVKAGAEAVKELGEQKTMKDNYEHIHQATDKRLLEMLEEIGLNLGVRGELESCAIIGEASRRLKAYQNRPELFNSEQFNL